MILTISNIKKSLKTIAFAAMFLLPLSCVNNLDVNDSPQEETKPAVKADEAGGDGASLNYCLYATVQGESARTALPSFPPSPVYYVEYSKLSDWGDSSKHVTKTPSSAPAAFTVNGSGAVTNFYLPLSSGTWVVEAGIKNGDQKLLTDRKTIPLTPEEPIANEAFFLQMPIVENGHGSLYLKVEAGSGSDINFIEMIVQCSDNTSITAQKSGSNPYYFTATNIPNGKQKIIINAYESTNNSGRQIFSTTQDLIIYNGLTSNNWLINGSNPTGNIYTITSQMVADYLPHQFYVDSTNGLDSNSGTTKDFPFQTMTKAISTIQDRNETNEFTIHIKDGSSFTNGGRTFIQQSIKIECWKNVPNDMLGSATWTLTADGNATSLQIGYTTTRGKLTIVSANDSCGLTLFGNNQDHTCIEIYNGDFIMDGGKITGFGTPSSNRTGAVNLPNNTYLSNRIVFTMRKGEISGNISSCPGVYAAPGTSFIMEGGKIINNTVNQTGFAVGVYGSMYISGLVQIGGTDDTDNKRSDGSKANVLLSTDNKFIINAPLSTGAHIGVSTQFGANQPTTTNQVAITQNYTNNEAPSAFFNYDEYDASARPYVFVRATQTGKIGEVALARGGGSIKSSRDFKLTFELSDGDSNTNNNQTLGSDPKEIIIDPVITLPDNTRLYYKAADNKFYLESSYTTKFSDEVLTWQAAELSMYGTPLPHTPYPGYQPSGVYDPENPPTQKTIIIPVLPYTGTYTLTLIATYMGIQYSANFDFTRS